MSNYRNFVQDFPARCRDVLVTFSDGAAKQDREVTLLLMAATAGFVVPYERLGEGDAIKQPTLDRPAFVDASEKLKALLAETIATCTLFEGLDSSWRGGPLQSADGTPEQWPECREPQALPPTTLVKEAVSWVRHALAHGNVLTRAEAERGNQISELVFVCGGTRRNEKAIPLRFVVMTPADLRHFLCNWFDFVSALGVPHHTVLDIVGEAA